MRSRSIRIAQFLTALLLTVFALGCRTPRQNPPISSASEETGGALMKEQAAYDVQHYDLSLAINPTNKSIAGLGTIEVKAIEPISWLVLDLDPRLRVKHVRISTPQNSGALTNSTFEQRGSKLWIFLHESRPRDARVVAAIEYSGCPRAAVRAPWDGGFTWSKTKSGHPWIATTVQGEGADLWWPCKDHPTDKPESFTLRIRVPKPLVVASNGRLLETLTHDDGTITYHWHTAYPISNYNVALNIAPYETISTNYTSVTGETIPVTYWVLPENKAKGEKLVPEMIEHLNFYERTLGPYPFRREKYGVAETPHLGMEHQSIIAYGNNYRGGPHGYDWLHHHELGHEWWGNLVTANDWRHFWIHEGFCTYMQALYAEEREGIAAYHHAIYDDRRKIRSQHALVPDHNVGMKEYDQGPGGDAYSKGALILHTLRYLVGRDQLLTILRCFCYPTLESEKIDAPVGRLVSTADFIRLAEEISGRKLDWFFALYLDQPKLPILKSEVRDGKLHLRWQTPTNFAFPMPVEVEVNGQIERIEMPNGQAELDATSFAHARVDPHMWILKESRLIHVASPGAK